MLEQRRAGSKGKRLAGPPGPARILGPMHPDAAVRPLLALLTTVAVFGGLYVSREVSLPVAFAAVLAVLFRPMQRRLERRVPRGVAVGAVMLTLLAALALIAAGVAYGVGAAAQEWPKYQEQAQGQLQGLGIRLPGGLGGGDSGSGGASGLLGAAAQALGGAVSGLSLLLLVVTFLALMLLEVDEFRRRASRVFGEDVGTRLVDAFRRMSGEFLSFLWVQAVTGALAAALSGLLLWLLGVPLAGVWVVVTFALEFLPTIGSVLAVIPPTLFALLSGGAGQGTLALLGLGIIQIGIGSFINPRMQGGQLGLSATVVAVSVVFWGWLWGIGGAIIAVPLTAGLALVFAEFPATRPIAAALGSGEARK